MATFKVSLDHATELGGCLYLVPGTHKLGRQEPYADEETTRTSSGRSRRSA